MKVIKVESTKSFVSKLGPRQAVGRAHRKLEADTLQYLRHIPTSTLLRPPPCAVEDKPVLFLCDVNLTEGFRLTTEVVRI